MLQKRKQSGTGVYPTSLALVPDLNGVPVLEAERFQSSSPVAPENSSKSPAYEVSGWWLHKPAHLLAHSSLEFFKRCARGDTKYNASLP
jgi:hypothetical protein